MKFEDEIFIIVMIALFIGYFFISKKFTNNFKDKNEFTISSIILLFILSIVFTITLPGASYLTVIPVLLIVISLLVKLLLSNVKYISYILLIPIALTTMLYVPTVYLFNCALTIGALCACVFFAMIAYIAILNSIINLD